MRKNNVQHILTLNFIMRQFVRITHNVDIKYMADI